MHTFMVTAVSLNWLVEQDDVEAAFLNGLRLERRLILQAPKEGLPAIPGVMEAVPPGTCLIALKGVYGVNDAPNLWGGRHAEGILENGATESALAPRTLFWWFSPEHADFPEVPLIGMVGTHVDDDLFAGNAWWTTHVLPKLKKTFAYIPSGKMDRRRSLTLDAVSHSPRTRSFWIKRNMPWG